MVLRRALGEPEARFTAPPDPTARSDIWWPQSSRIARMSAKILAITN